MVLPIWCLAFVFGVASALTANISPVGTMAGRVISGFSLWLGLWSLALFSAAAGWRLGGRNALLVGPLGSLFLLGFVLGGQELGQREDLRASGLPPAGREVVLEGVLIDDPAPATGGTRLRMRIAEVQTGRTITDANFDADVYAESYYSLATGRSGSDFKYGDRYRVRGTFLAYVDSEQLLAGSVNARDLTLLVDPGGHPVRRALAGLRSRLAESIKQAVPGDAGGLAAAVLVDDRRGIGQEWTQNFRDAGTAHLLAISGMNVTLLGGLALAGATWAVGRRQKLHLVAAFLITWGYAGLGGFSPSVVRAAIMFTAYLMAMALGRQRSALPAVGLAATIMVAISPDVLESISFQLSFAAVAGMAMLAPSIADRLRLLLDALGVRADAASGGLVNVVVTGVSIGLAATIGTAPLFLFHFGTFASWGVVATLLAEPVMPVLILAAAATGFAGLFSAPVASVLGWQAWIAGQYFGAVSSFFASLPPGPIEPPWWGPAALGALYVAAAIYLLRRQIVAAAGLLAAVSVTGATRRHMQRVPWRPPALLTGSVLIGAALLWAGALSSRHDDLLRVTFFETDVGDAIFIETPNRTQVLIDGGRGAEGALRSLERRMPFWDRTLDVVIATHGDGDHIGGLPAVLDRYRTGNVVDVPFEGAEQTQIYKRWLELAGSLKQRVTVNGGEVIALDDGVMLEVISAGPIYPGAGDNDSGVVTRLSFGSVSMLFPADIEQEAETALVSRGANIRATVLQAPHHGSAGSSSEQLLRAVSPAAVVVSAGVRNTYGHPAGAAMSRLKEAVPESQIFVTKERGNVTFLTDGLRLWVETDR